MYSEYWGDVAFDAKAGHTYQLMAYKESHIPIPFVTSEPIPPSIWVEDKGTKETVAGSKPDK